MALNPLRGEEEMYKKGALSSSRNTIKTDLSLLLECLKFQMKCPDLQKQALLTIHSICEKREDNVDLFREMGGVAFVFNLSKSSVVHSDVTEAALFTLGTLVEANVYCKNSLCRKETFADLAGWLMKDDFPLTQKRVTVYLLSALVANNKLGQTLAQTTGCLDILLGLFRTTFPLSTDGTSIAANATHTYQLWTSVSSALCGCVNNPQNEEGQRICVVAFPVIKIWLQQVALQRTEIFKSICSFVAMTVANNSRVQESFSASGGLETLALSLVHLTSVADVSLLSCQLSVIISKTLSACITDNTALASGLAQYSIVAHLFSLLASPNLDPKDRLSVLLTLGHCTEASEEHQSQLVQSGGLPLIITLLAEDTSEEVRRAATFILQTCKQATMSLGVPDLTARHGEDENAEPLTNMESFRSSARELLRRIDLLEKKQAKEAEDDEKEQDLSTSAEGLLLPSQSPALRHPLQHKGSIKSIPTAYRHAATDKHIEAECDNIKLQIVSDMIMKENDSEKKSTSSKLSTQKDEAQTSGKCEWCSVCKGAGSNVSFHVKSLEGGREPHMVDSQLFKLPAQVRHSVPKEIKCADEKGVQGQEKMGKITAEEHSLAHCRCTGCVLVFEKVTSRTFASLQSSCHHSCEMHKALEAATEQFRTSRHSLQLRREYQDNTGMLTSQKSERAPSTKLQRSKNSWKEVCLTPICKEEGKSKGFLTAPGWKKHNDITLTALHRGAEKELSSYNKTERRGGNKSRHHILDDNLTTSTDHCTARRKRKDFSLEEVHSLLSGVKTFGYSWNSILWSYPFQPGRTNVDLAKKYRQLMRGKTQGTDYA